MSRPGTFRLLALSAAAVAVSGMATIAVRTYVRMSDSLTHGLRSHVTPEASARAFAGIRGLTDATFRTSDGLTLRG
jgi:hypothetical protein